VEFVKEKDVEKGQGMEDGKDGSWD